MRRYRIVAVVILVGLVLAACEPVSAPTSSTSDVLPPPQPIGPTTNPTTTTVASAPSTIDEPSRLTYQGFLPDGTHFQAQFPDPIEDLLVLVQGTFSVRSDEGVVPVGKVRYTRVLDPGELGYLDGILRLWADPWLVEVFFDEATIPDLNAAPFGAGIELTTRDGFPVLDLSEPYTWTGADPQLRYVSFVVATGCWPEAARCTDNHAVQVISADEIFMGNVGLSELQVEAMTLSTKSLRPEHDPNYLDPGPLTRRNSASVMWTGSEMIVWGGKEDRDGVPNLIDGAAFNPETNQWRFVAPIPLERRTPARAIWAEGEMVVVSTDGTFGYEPRSDRWRSIGNGLRPPEFPDRMLFFDGSIYVWDLSFSMHRMDLEVGQWEMITAPDEIAGGVDPWSGILREVDRRLIAITVSGNCQPRDFWVLTVDGWNPLPEVSLATAEYSDCSSANQTATLGDGLIIWNSYYSRAMSYSFGLDHWHEVFPIPLDGTEGDSGPVGMNHEQFMVPRWDQGAIFDARTEEWSQIVLPGIGSDAEIIWTGEEFLAWGVYPSFDAWRFTQPPGTAGGADTS